MSTCLSHIGEERGSMISGSTEPGIELSEQLEQLWKDAIKEANKGSNNERLQPTPPK